MLLLPPTLQDLQISLWNLIFSSYFSGSIIMSRRSCFSRLNFDFDFEFFFFLNCDCFSWRFEANICDSCYIGDW